MSSNIFELDDALTYQKPAVSVSGEQNFVSFKPSEAGPFTSNQSFSINVNSTTAFIDPTKMWLKYKLRLTGGTSAGSTTISASGGAMVVKSLTTSVGGLQVERINNYNQYVSIQHKRGTGENTNLLKDLECVASTTALTVDANYANGRYVVHALKNCITQQQQLVPLPYIRGGIRFEFQLDTINNAVLSLATSTDFEVSDVQLICSMISPSDDYMKSFQSSLENGKTASIQTVITNSYQTSLNATTQQSVDILCGFVQSLKSITFTQRASASLNSSTVDAFNNDTHDKLKSWYLSVGSSRYPQNFYISTTNVNSLGVIDPTSLALVNGKGNYASIDSKVAYTTSTDCVNSYRFGSNSFGAGAQVADGKLTLSLEFNSAPTTGNQVDVFLQSDALIEIGAGGIILNQKSL